MKKLIIICLIISLALSLFTACGKKVDTDITDNETTGQRVDDGEDRTEPTGYTDPAESSGFSFLSEGDKIAVISPSSMPTREQVDTTMAGLRAWGFEPVEGKHAYAEVRTLADCVEDFEWALEDPEIKAIFCVRGGYGATEVMDNVSTELIASAKKLIIGYSDVTVYHAAWSSLGLPSIHASMSAAFNELPKECARDELNMMKGETPEYTFSAGRYSKTGSAEGILIGGNLSTFAATLGSSYDCTKLGQPYILFFEEVGEDMRHIHRFLTVLKNHGVLDNAAGIIFGDLSEIPTDSGNFGTDRGGYFSSAEDMITKEILADIDVPVAFGFPAGHGYVNYPMLFGTTARLEVSGDSFSLSWVK